MKPTDQPVVAEQIVESVKRQRESTERFAEPVTTTLPACLCGLDTNPVASPRMDIHCPKHDAPETSGGPQWIRRLAQRIRHHQMKGYIMYTEDQLVASITDEYNKRARVSQPAPQVEGATLSRSERIAAEVVSKWMATPDRHYADLISAVAESVDAAQPLPTPTDEVAQRAWQPIETAPKDGTQILFARTQPWSSSANVCVGFWADESQTNNSHWKTENGFMVDTRVYRLWMPLPDPPSFTATDVEQEREEGEGDG